MNLKETLSQLAALDGYVYHRLRATDHAGEVKCYTFWFQKNGEIKDYEVRILVIDEGGPDESAHVYSTAHIMSATPFRDEIEAAIPTYLAAHSEIDRVMIDTVDEPNKIAMVDLYKYMSASDTVKEERGIVYKKAGSLVIKMLES
jgi:hypothetical protein